MRQVSRIIQYNFRIGPTDLCWVESSLKRPYLLATLGPFYRSPRSELPGNSMLLNEASVSMSQSSTWIPYSGNYRTVS